MAIWVNASKKIAVPYPKPEEKNPRNVNALIQIFFHNRGTEEERRKERPLFLGASVVKSLNGLS